MTNTRRVRYSLDAAAGLLCAVDEGSAPLAVSVLAGGSPTSITVAGKHVIDATPGAVRD